MSDFNTKDVISASVAVHRVNGGFVKKDQIRYDEKYKDATSNSQMLYQHFFEGDKVEITERDQDAADEIISYLKGLSFKAIERNLTDFEKNVLRLVSGNTVAKDSIGIAASLPKVYYNKIEQDKWTDREYALSTTSNPLGELNKRATFTATVEFCRWIPTTMSYLVTASVDNKHILKFFSQDPVVAKKDKLITISGYVKSQEKSRYHNGIETMINRIKIEKTD